MKRKFVSWVLAAVMIVSLLPAMAMASDGAVGGSTVVRVEDTGTWYGDKTKEFDTLDSYWNDVVTKAPADYAVDADDKTVTIPSAEALVWWAEQVNAGIPFAGYTVSITKDIDLSDHYWTPICTGTVSYSDSSGSYSIASNETLEGTVICGNGNTITGLHTQTGVRGPNQDSKPGDGQNCFYYSAFIGYNSCDVTMQDLTFDKASIAISSPFEEVTQKGSSTVSVVVGAQIGGSLTLNRVSVTNAAVLAMQKASAFVGNLTGGSTLTVNQCEISDSTFSALFMVAPIAGYGKTTQIDVNGIRLSGNTIEVVEMTGSTYEIDPETGAQYWFDERDSTTILNASTTIVTSDMTGLTEFGKELPLVAEVDGYVYPTLADAVDAVAKSESKKGTVKLLQDASGAGIALYNSETGSGVDLTIDLGGYTYTCTEPVGSPGTESQAVHLERDNTVRLKNGTIQAAADKGFGMLVQNYSNLTMEDLSLIGAAGTQYGISSNYGDMILNRVSVKNAEVGIDVMHWLGTGYGDKAPTMVINNTDEQIVEGSIDVYCYDQNTATVVDTCEDEASLTLNGGVYTDDPTDYLPEDGGVVVKTDSGYVVHRLVAVPAKDATCTEPGNIACFYCDSCGKYFADENCAKELAAEDIVVPAKGHHYVDGVCTVCGAEETSPETGDHSQLGLWMALVLISCGGIAVLAVSKKRQSKR